MNTSFENTLTFQFPKDFSGPLPAHGLRLASPFGSLASGMQQPPPQVNMFWHIF
jgi:hypothetical protein